MFKNLRINIKLSGLLLIALAIATAIVYFIVSSNENNLNQVLENRILTEAESLEVRFQILEREDSKMLGASLEVFLHNGDGLKEAFIGKDREKLGKLGEALFQDLKNKYDITHFYFHGKNGVNFARLHNKEKYGDIINRITFKKSQETKGPGIGIELGKTAFALRFVQPYYNEDELIGYVELGKEIDRFLKTLREETKGDYAILVRKEFLDEKDWASVVEVKKKENNWDDLSEYIVIDSTLDFPDKELSSSCFIDKNAKKSEAEVSILSRIQQNNKHYACLGFPLKDASGKVVGAVLSLDDVTGIFESVQESAIFTLAALVAVFLIIFIIFLLSVSKIIVSPLKKIKDVAVQISQGNMDMKIDTSGEDELAELSQAIDDMKNSLKAVFEEYEKGVKRKKK